MKPRKPIAWRNRRASLSSLVSRFEAWQASRKPLVLLSKESKPIDPNDPGLLARYADWSANRRFVVSE
jgi:hypothetical protein